MDSLAHSNLTILMLQFLIGNNDVEGENTNVNIVNTTNNDFLGFENASELSDMEDIDEDEDSPPGELDI